METESSALPRFRTDLVAQPIDEQGQRFVDVTDPDSGATFRFYDVEYSIACAMDGKRDLDELVDYALEELGLEASPEELETVIGTLDELGYLELVSAEDMAGEQEVVGVTDVAAGQESEVDLIEGFELGAAGGSPDEVAASAPVEDIAGEELELGAPGRSPIAEPRPETPRAPELELGAAGTATPAQEVAASAAVRAITADLPEDEGGEVADEMSFAGLLDEDEAPTSIRVSPADMPAAAAQAGAEDAPTTVRGDAPARPAAGMPDFDEEEGLTPPPAAEPIPTLTPRGPSDSDYDGPTNLPPPQVPDYDDDDVSVDLSQHLSIDAEDVKEAVRASKVMDAVTVPDELLAEVEAAEGGAAEAEAKPVADKKPEAAAEEAAKPAAAKKPEPKKEPKPIELPEKPAKVAAKKKAATAKELPDVAEREKAAQERKGVSPVLLVLFIIVLVGGAAAYYFLIYKPKQDEQSKPRPPRSTKTGPVAPSEGPKSLPPPAIVAAKLSAAEPQVEVVVMAKDGVVAWLADADAQVAAGDRVAKLREFDRWERKLREYKAREEHYQRKFDAANEKLEQAKAAGNQVDVKRYEAEAAKNQTKVEEKRALFDEARDALMQSELKTPVAGTVEQVARIGALVKAGAPVVKVSTAPGLAATFDLPEGKSVDAYPVDLEVGLTGKADPSAKATCVVSGAEENRVTVACPADGAFAAGDEVVLE